MKEMVTKKEIGSTSHGKPTIVIGTSFNESEKKGFSSLERADWDDKKCQPDYE